MRNINNLQKSNKLKLQKLNLSSAKEPKSTLDITKLVVKSLDADYHKADLQSIGNSHCTHLDAKQKEHLLQLLREFEQLFDGALGDWKTKPGFFQLKEGVT